MAKVVRINHISLLVNDLEGPLSFWRDGLGLEVAHIHDLKDEQALVAFIPAGDSEIELVKPTTADSGLARFLEKRGPGMHHICLEVDDIQGMLAQLRQKGVEVINETPKVGNDGRKYAFIHPKSAHGVLVELYEMPSYHHGGDW
jgi:methylmalonyl-CoA/ethylmalonyl-CoA epimerase